MDVLKTPVKNAYFRLLTMAMGGAFAGCVFSLIDAMVVGKYHGPAGTATLAVVGPMLSVLYGMGFLTGIGGSVWFSNLRGKGKRQQADSYFTVAVILSVVFSAGILVLLFFSGEAVLRLFGAEGEILVLGKRYLEGVFWALPCCTITNLLAAFIRNDGNPLLVTVSVVTGGAFNLLGDIFFVYICDMGIYGAGFATALSLFMITLIMLSHFFTPKSTLRLVRPSDFWRKTCRIAVTGFPTALNDIAMGVLAVLFNRQIMKYLNENALAVFGVVNQITVFVQCCAYSAGQAAQPILSQNLGAEKPTRVRQCLRYGLYTGCFFGILWTGLSLLVPNAFVRFFMTPTAAVLQIAPKIIGTYGLSYVLLAFNVFLTYYFQAILRPAAATAVSLGRGVLVSGAVVLLLPALFGADAIWLTMLITDMMVGIFAAAAMVKYTKKL